MHTSNPKAPTTMHASIAQYIDLYQAHGDDLRAHAPELLNSLRPEAEAFLRGAELPGLDNDVSPVVSLRELFAPDYGVNLCRVAFPVDAAETFHCGVPNVTTALAFVAGDAFVPTKGLSRALPDGVTVQSLAQAAEQAPALVASYLGKAACEPNAAVALNTLLLQDGVLVRVAAGVKVEKPIQIVNILNALAPMMAVRRIIIALEQGAQADVLICDHTSRMDVQYLSNQVVELFLAPGSSLNLYEMEEESPLTSRVEHIYARQMADSSLTINASTLSGGASYSRATVSCLEPGTHTQITGMAVASASQTVANITDMRHIAPHCESTQTFKYVLDQQARASFFGMVKVDPDAHHTNAYQLNRNILASPDARVYTRPQLEIYCDEVKCSHGATIGQLDERALFYMQSRGIPRAQARLMLMQAFMADVIDTVRIPSLATRLQQLIDRRLSGRDMQCADCRASESLEP